MKPHGDGTGITDEMVLKAYGRWERGGIRPIEDLVLTTGQPLKMCYRAMQRADKAMIDKLLDIDGRLILETDRERGELRVVLERDVSLERDGPLGGRDTVTRYVSLDAIRDATSREGMASVVLGSMLDSLESLRVTRHG